MAETYTLVPNSYLKKIDQILDHIKGNVAVGNDWMNVKRFMQQTGMTRDEVRNYRKKHLGEPGKIRPYGNFFQYNYREYVKQFK